MTTAKSLTVVLWCWHAPYAALLARALPEVAFRTLPTPYCPDGWNARQRPLPENVLPAPELIATDPDVVLLQTGFDIDAMLRAEWPGAAVYLSHNRAELEGQGVAEWLNDTGIPVISISPMKAQSWLDAGYRPFKGGIPVILPYVDPADYPVWTGEGGYVLTVANNLRRPLFDAEAWIEATKGLPVKLVGEGNEGIPGAVGPATDWDELKRLYREAAVYLNPTVAPWEDAHNLAMLEAAATGTPIVSLHEDSAGLAFHWKTTRTDVEVVLRTAGAPVMREAVSPATRRNTAARFPKDRFAAQWRAVLEEVTK
ncbi:MAG TPA: hypothetical protein VD948_12855 [Rhodothermales bacterium]|nr:hypothetical protein [Rhodothermales bacterium]